PSVLLSDEMGEFQPNAYCPIRCDLASAERQIWRAAPASGLRCGYSPASSPSTASRSRSDETMPQCEPLPTGPVNTKPRVTASANATPPTAPPLPDSARSTKTAPGTGPTRSPGNNHHQLTAICRLAAPARPACP